MGTIVGWLRSRVAARRAWPVLRDRRGAATAEYALLLALIVIILIGTLSTLGQVLNVKLQAIIQDLQQAGN